MISANAVMTGSYDYGEVARSILIAVAKFRRLRIRYEKRADIHEAFLVLGCVMICWNFLAYEEI